MTISRSPLRLFPLHDKNSVESGDDLPLSLELTIGEDISDRSWTSRKKGQTLSRLMRFLRVERMRSCAISMGEMRVTD